MENSLEITNNQNFNTYEEYTIPKVSADGEPHEVMTMVAAFSGIIAAIVILIVLIMVIGCGNTNRQNSNRNNQQNNNEDIKSSSENNLNKSTSTIIPMFQKQKTLDGKSNLISVSTISIKNEGYINPVSNEIPTSMTSDNKDELILKTIKLPEITTIHC